MYLEQGIRTEDRNEWIEELFCSLNWSGLVRDGLDVEYERKGDVKDDS